MKNKLKPINKIIIYQSTLWNPRSGRKGLRNRRRRRKTNGIIEEMCDGKWEVVALLGRDLMLIWKDINTPRDKRECQLRFQWKGHVSILESTTSTKFLSFCSKISLLLFYFGWVVESLPPVLLVLFVFNVLYSFL